MFATKFGGWGTNARKARRSGVSQFVTDRRRPWIERLEDRTLLSLASASNDQILQDYGQVPLSFQINEGQTSPQVEYLSQGSGYSLFLTPTESMLSLQAPATNSGTSESVALSSSFVGANPQPTVVGLDPLGGTSNYFAGSNPSGWHTGIANYGEVEYQNLYKGVDLVFYGNQQQLEYDYIVSPGTDPGIITMAIAGAESMTIDSHGNLVLATVGGDVTEDAPVVYQKIGGVKQAVSGQFALEGGDEVRFEVGAYDHAQALIIDPVLSYSTYLGGSNGATSASSIAVNSEGDAYVTGGSQATDFPTTDGAYQTTGGGTFVTELNPSGTGVVYSTFIAGTGAASIALDGSGNVYLTGVIDSSELPTTAGAFQTDFGGVGDAFITELNSTGTALVYSTYLGGSGFDGGTSIAVDSAGDAYVTGETSSVDFPTTPGAFQTIYGGGPQDAFVTEINATGTALIYSTYIGGSGLDGGQGIAIDAAGDAYVTGYTQSSNFPVTAGAYQSSLAGGSNVFITKLNPSGDGLIYSTYVGGSDSDTGYAIAIDSDGDAFVTGTTSSADFPTTSGAQQIAYGGGNDGFVTKLNTSGTGLVYSTYLGGEGSEVGQSVAVDSSGDAYVTGTTNSTNFPTTSDAIQTALGGSNDYDDAFLTELNGLGTSLIYSTYLGGENYDYGDGIAIDSLDNVYIAGITWSLEFPTTPGALQSSHPAAEGRYNAFVAKFDLQLQTSTALVTATDPSTYGDSISFTATVTADGSPVTTGTVEFEDGETVLANMVPLGGTGTAILNISTLSAITQTITALYSGATGFAMSAGTVQQVVSPKAASVTPNASSKVYGSPDPELTGTLSGFLPADEVTASFARAPGETVEGDPYVISATLSPSGVLSNYDITYNTAPFTITPASLTVTATLNQSMVYGTPTPELVFTYAGLENGDASASFTGALSTPATSSSDIGGYLITQGTLAATGNYTIGTFDPAAFTVTAAPLTITADDEAKTYGTLENLPSTAFTEIGLVTANGDTISGVTEVSLGASARAAVGTSAIVPSGATGTGLNNYAIMYVDGTLTVNPSSLIITANDDSKRYGTLTSFTSSAFNETGLVTTNGDTIIGVTESSDGAPVSASVGSDPIVPSAATGGGLSNYTITYVDGTLTVIPAPLVITADDESKTYGTLKSFTGAAFTEIGLVTINGDTIAGVTETSVGSTISATVGGYPIVPGGAAGSGLTNYMITYTSGTLTVDPAPLTIVADDQTKMYGMFESFPSNAFIQAGLVTANGDTITGVTEISVRSPAWAPVGSDPIVPGDATGTGLSNYTITYVDGTLAVTPAPLTITATSLSMIAGQAVPALTVSYSGFQNGNNPASLTTPPNISTTATSASPPGMYPIEINGASSLNYTINYVGGVLTVTPAPAEVRSVLIETIKTSKHKKAKVIVIQFSESMNASTVEDLLNYSLVTVPPKRNEKIKAVSIASATYSPGAFTVDLATRKPLVVNPPLKLTIIGSGVLDSYGDPLAGDGSGTPGTNAVVIITRTGAAIQREAPSVRPRGSWAQR